MSKLPGLNFDSKLGVQDLSYYAGIIEDAILKRAMITVGYKAYADYRYGIIDLINPRYIVASDTTRPLLVYNSTNSVLKINVTPGIVLAPNGTIIELSALIEDFDLSRVNASDINVVFLENEIIDTDPIRVTIYNQNQYVRKAQSTMLLRTALLTDFNNAVLFPPLRKENIVVLAVVTVVETATGLELQFDYSNSNYTFNRPWFSPTDIEHRSLIGSGIYTEQNPHGLSYNDLSSGNLTLYDQLLRYGIIQSRDDDFKGITGIFCTEIITASRILTDYSGAMTADSQYGGINAKYIVLTSYPINVMSFYISSHKARAVAYDWIEGTRIVVLPLYEGFTTDAVIHYTRANAAEPPNAILSNQITFGQPNLDRELIYTGGLSTNTFTNPNIDFDGSGPYPMDYMVYINKDFSLLRSPQSIGTTLLLEEIGTTVYPISQEQFGLAKIKVGLADANPVATMQVILTITGKDYQGLSASETLTFNGTTWSMPSIPGIETDAQFLVTDTLFSAVTSIQVTSRTDDGPLSKVKIWARLETGTALELNKLARIAKVTWDGTVIQAIKDLRNVVPTLIQENHKYAGIAGSFGLRTVYDRTLVFSEDLNVPKYYETIPGYQSATASTFSIVVNDWGTITAGDIITLRPGKILTATASPTPNRSIGEFYPNTTEEDTRNDMLSTINYSGFASGITATAVNLDAILCTKQTLGSRGNEAVSITTAITIPPPMSLSGVFNNKSIGGYDDFGEIFIPKHVNELDSSVPSTSTYNVTGIRNRYLSRAIPISVKKRITIILHDVNFSKIQFRTRLAYTTDTEWQPWVAHTVTSAFIDITDTLNITKIQIEVFGQCGGLSVFEGNLT